MFDSIVAKEGHKKIIVAFIAFLFFVIVECTFMTLISFVAFLFFIYAYRYKYIDVNTLEKNRIYAPISGKVTAIDVKDFKKSIYIDVSLCDSHILRSSDSGKCKISFKKGVNLLLTSYKSKQLNNSVTIEFKNSSMKIYSSMCNDSLVIPKKDELKKGEKLGTLLHGEVIVTFNEKYNCNVNIGQKIESGLTVLASC